MVYAENLFLVSYVVVLLDWDFYMMIHDVSNQFM